MGSHKGSCWSATFAACKTMFLFISTLFHASVCIRKAVTSAWCLRVKVKEYSVVLGWECYVHIPLIGQCVSACAVFLLRIALLPPCFFNINLILIECIPVIGQRVSAVCARVSPLAPCTSLIAPHTPSRAPPTQQQHTKWTSKKDINVFYIPPH